MFAYVLQGIVTFNVQVPNISDKPEWQCSGQAIPLTLPLTDTVRVHVYFLTLPLTDTVRVHVYFLTLPLTDTVRVHVYFLTLPLTDTVRVLSKYIGVDNYY